MKKVFVQVKTADGEHKLVPKEEYYRSEGPKGPFVFGDITPYTAVTGDMAGKTISSRSQHREFLKRNNLIEVGNEKSYFTKHRGMTPENPWARPNYSERKHEESIAKSLRKNYDILRSR